MDRRFLCLFVAFVIAASTTNASPDHAADPRLPLGLWRIEFTNGVVESCDIQRDGTAVVNEAARSSRGRAATDGAVMVRFDDDRIERWTPVGKRYVVEHWFPASQFPPAAPVLGIAERDE
jgi:hypothetical protein